MEKKYITDNPNLIAEWNYEKNIDLDPSKITLGSDKKAWWLCKEGHTWSASVSNRAKGRGCPICCGKIVLTGYNDLATRYPSLSLDFDIKRNKINPQNVFAGGTKKYWWICPNGHSYQCSIHNRAIIKVGCPYCAGKSVEIGYNDLKSKYPDLAKEFNEEKNKINSEDVFMRSTKSYWWKCPKGHEYKMPVEKRVKRNHGCPYCSGHRVILGFNDLSTTHPQLFSEWDIEKNRPHKFTDFSHGSTYKAWWKCKNGHIYQTTINEKCGSNRGCPYCANSQILTGYNDLATTNPEIALEWHPTKNKLNPTQVFAGSTHKYWWLCPMGHEYLATPNHRTSGTSCPTCNRERKISFPEKVIFYYVAKCFHNTKENYSADFENKMNLDIFVPELKLGIEYDGFHWHKNPQKDNIKNQECKKSNITLIRIREEGLPQLDGYSIDYYTKKNDFLNIFEFIKKMLNAKYKINVNFDINLERDMSDINSLVLFSEKKNNISTVCPELIKEWDFEKNSPLKIESLTKGSTKKVWWKCSKGHEWQAVIRDRNKGSGCPECYKARRRKQPKEST